MDETNNQSSNPSAEIQNPTPTTPPAEPPRTTEPVSPPSVSSPLPPAPAPVASVPTDNPHSVVPTPLPSNKPLVALLLGITALVAWIYPYGGIVIGSIGLYLGIKGKNTAGKRLAVAGIILCSIGLVLSLTNLALYYLYVNITENKVIEDLPNLNASSTNPIGVASSTLTTVSPWQEFTSTSSGFSILVPNVPQKQRSTNT